MTNGSKIVIGIADMKMTNQGNELITYALGSCCGICLLDPNVRLAAMIHIMLPLNMEAGRTNTMKYVDTGIRETIKQMEAKGARRARITAKVAGGAKMFAVSGSGALGNIGQRNIESVHKVLKAEGIRLIAEDVGGSVARTLSFDPATGKATIKSYGKQDIVL